MIDKNQDNNTHDMKDNDHLAMHTKSGVESNVEKLAQLFPHCVTEAEDEDGHIQQFFDFDMLEQELSSCLVEGNTERYRLDWVGKKKAIVEANTPIAKTLRPVREDSVDFDTTENLFIEGDNLDALKLLQESYLGKVKIIYIDPPYNTGKDFIYKDNFTECTDDFLQRSEQKDKDGNRLISNTESNGRFHSDWLTMMFSRLKLARNLLSDDGVIFISIDEKEIANLHKLCDEIFGEKNFAGEIIWKNSSKNDQDYISIQHEYFLVYVKNKQINKGSWLEKKVGLDEIYKAFDTFQKEYGKDWMAIHYAALEWYKQFPPSNPIFECKHYNWLDETGIYFPSDISGPNHGQYVYDVIHPTTGEVCKAPSSGWRYPQSTMEQRIKGELVHFGKDHTTVPNNKTYLRNTEFNSLTSIKYKDGRVASKKLTQLFGVNIFTNPKDGDLLTELFASFDLKESDIVLDFFAGSATTAESCFSLNVMKNMRCKFILVQYPENLEKVVKTATGGTKATIKRAISFLKSQNRPLTVAEISKERIRRAGAKIKQDNADKDGIDTLDTGFRVLKVDSTNMRDVYYRPDEYRQDMLAQMESNIKDDRSGEDLLFQVMLDWAIPLTLPIEEKIIQGTTVYFVGFNSLVASFDSITTEMIDEIAPLKPLKFVSCERAIAHDQDKTNIKERLKQLSPETEVKFI